MNDKSLTIQDAAKFLGVSKTTLRRWEERQILLPFRTAGNQRRYSMDQLQAFKANGLQAAKAMAGATDTAPINEQVGISVEELSKNLFKEEPSEQGQPLYQNDASVETTAEDAQPASNVQLSSAPAAERKMHLTFHLSRLGSIWYNRPNVASITAAIVFAGVIIMLGFLLVAGATLRLGSGADGADSELTVEGTVSTDGNLLVAGQKKNQPEFVLRVNVPGIFGQKVSFLDSAEIAKNLKVTGLSELNGGIATNNADIDAGNGRLTASNVIYSLLAGSNVTITGDPQNPTISANASGVTSFQGQTGELSLTNGSGIGLSGLEITNTGVLSVQGQTGAVSFVEGTGIAISGLTITNSDPGSSQKIFGTFSVEGTSIQAGSNTDTITFAAGSGVTLTPNTTDKSITISANSGGTTQWTTTGSDIYYNAGNVGIGNTAPGATLDVTGTGRFSGALTVSSLGTGVVKADANGLLSSSAIGLGTADVTGTLGIGNGGTGVTATPINGQVLIGNGSGYTLSTLTAGSGVGITNGAGTITIANNGVLTLSGTANQISTSGSTGAITLSLPQNIHTAATPTFASLSLTANTNQLTLGTGNTGVISLGTLSTGRTYTLPDASGEICLDSGNCPSGGGGNISGSGTGNYLAKFTSASTIANSLLYDSGGGIGIGTTSPQGLFSVSGGATGVALVSLNETGDQNILVGSASGTTRFVFDRSGNLSLNGGDYQIGGTSVLSSSSLGSGVVSSSLTSVGALDAGSITSGFGSIDTGTDAISGGDLTSSGATGFTASGNGAGLTFSGTGNHIISASSGVLQLGALTLTSAVTGNSQSITGLSDFSAAGTITFGGLTTNNGLLYTNGSGVLNQAVAGTSGQLLVADASGVPTFVTLGTDATLAANGALTIAADAVALGTDTTGNYVANLTGGSGIAISGSAGEGWTPSVALSALTADWDQTGAFDIVLNNASSELRILESAGGTYFGAIDAGDLSDNRTYILPDYNGTICLVEAGNCAGSGTGVTTPGGTVNRLVKFTGPQSVSNASINDLYTAGVALTIDAFGKVGIGTATPSAQLDVQGGGTGGNAALIVNQTGASSNDIFTASSSGTTRFRIANNGNLVASGTLTGLTGLTSSGTINFSGLTANRAIFTDGSSNLTTTGASSALLDALSDETGTGLAVFNTSPTFATSLITGSTSFDLFNTTATTLNIGGAATTLNLGAATGTATINNAVINLQNGSLRTAGTERLSNAGALSNITGYTQTSGVFSATLTGSNTALFGSTTANADSIALAPNASGSNAFTGTISTDDLTAARTYTLPDASGTICISGQMCASTGTVGYLQRTNGALAPANITDDFLLGGIATSSAKFAFINNAGGTPTASISANGGTNSATYLTGNGILATTNAQTLTLGSATTGNVVIDAGSNILQLADNGIELTGSAPVISATTTNANIQLTTNGTGLLTLNAGATGNIEFFSNANTLSSGGNLTLAGTVAIPNGNTITGVSNFAQFSQGISVGGATTYNINAGTSNLNALTLNGTFAVNQGGAAATRTNIDASGNIMPGTTGQADIGSPTLRWNNIYANNIFAGNTPGVHGWWQRYPGTVSPTNITDDLLLGGIATASAKIAFVNIADGTPTASLSANSGDNATFLTGDGNLGTTNGQTLTIGGTTTGNIILSPQNGMGKVQSNGSINLASGKTYQINGLDVLSNNTLGSGVIASSLTSVGTLTGGEWQATTIGTLYGGTGTTSIGSAGSIAYSNGTSYAFSGVGTSGYCLTSGGSGAPTWQSCALGAGTNFWNSANGALYAGNTTTDLLIGGTASNSAKFAVLNVNNGTPTASVSAGTNGAAFLTAAGNLQTTNRQSLTLGGGDTGNIVLSGLGTGVVQTNSSGVLSSSAIDLSDGNFVTNVLDETNGGTGISTYDAGDLLYGSGPDTLSRLGIGAPGQILTVSGGLPVWQDPGGTINYWQRGDGAISPLNVTDDFLLGATATSSAKFAFINVSGGTPTASIAGNIVLDSAGTIQTTKNQALTIGGATTGNITLSPQNGNGTVTSTGDLILSSGKVFRINGSQVLSETALGTSVTGSSLTSVGTLTSGVWNASNIGSQYGGTGDNTSGTTGVPYIVSGDWLYEAALDETRGGTGISSYTVGDLLYASGANTLGKLGIGGTNAVLTSTGSAPQWSTSLTLSGVTPSGTSGTFGWIQRNNGAIAPTNITDDFLLGGTATASARFAFTNVSGSGTPTASISATTSGLSLGGDGTIQSLRRGTLTLGGNTTGNIAIDAGSGLIAIADNTTIAGDLDLSGTLTAGTADAFHVAANGAVTTVTDETINGIDINAGAVSDVTNLTINNGGDLTIGSIGLNDIGTSNVTSGASLIGVYDEFSNSDSTTVQDVLDDFDAVLGAGASKWNSDTGTIYPATIANRVGIGTQTTGDIISSLYVTRNLASGALGKSVAVFNQTENQDIFTASSSGTTRLVLTNGGNLNIIGGAYQIGGTTVLSSNALGTGVLSSSLTSVGALDGGSITANFGAINVGNDAISTTGTGSFGDISCSSTTCITLGTETGGDYVASLTAGAGLTGTATGEGSTPTLAIGAGNGITVNADDVTIDATTTGTTATTSSNSGLEVTAGGLRLLGGCSNGYILKWNSSSSLWECAADAGGAGAAGVVNVENNDAAVGTNVDTLDFSTDFTLAASPSNEANISIADDILNYTELNDSLSLDAATSLAFGNFDYTLGTNSGTGGLLMSPNAGGNAALIINKQGTAGDILTASASGTTQMTLDRSGNFSIEGAISDLSGNTLAVNDNLDVSGTLTAGTADAFSVAVTGAITTVTDETINGIDINAGAISDVTNITINNGGDLTIGSIGLNDVGSSNITSGASLIGVYDELTNSNATTLQDVLDDLDAAIGAGASKWTISGNVIYPAAIDNQVGIGTQTAGDVISSFYVTRDQASGALGKALAIFNQTENQDIFTASASGATRFVVTNAGNISVAAGAALDTLTAGSLGIGNTTANALTIGRSGITTTFGSTAWTATPTISGLITATSGVTANGALTANSTFTLGDGGDAGAINTNDWAISATGDLSGIGSIGANGNITQTGATTFSTGTGAVSLNGDVTVQSDNSLTLAGLTTNGGVLYTNGSGTVAQTTAGSAGQCLTSNAGSAPSWRTCALGSGTNYWDSTNGALHTINQTMDLLIGGTASDSAKFAVLNVAGGTPTASVSAGTNGAVYLTAAGTLQTTANQSLSLGGDTTGNILLNSDGNGFVGIGTTTPATALHVGLNGEVVTLGDGTNTSTSMSVSGDRGQFGYDGNNAVVQGGLTKGIEFNVNNNTFGSGTAMVITSTGNVGIGVTSPTALLDVSGAASVSGQLSFRTGAGAIQTTANNTLTIGGDTTGDITLSPLNGSGTVTSTGNMNLASGKTYKINGTDVLSATALGNAVTGSNLSSVGTLTSGTWNATIIGTQYGGTGQNFSAVAQGALPYFSSTGTMSTLGIGGTNAVLTSSGSVPQWSTSLTLSGVTPSGTTGRFGWFQRNNGAIAPANITDDLLLGATATTSARFAFTNVSGAGTPTASISATTSGLSLGGNGTIQSLRMGTLTIGGSTTGNIVIDSGSNAIMLSDPTGFSGLATFNAGATVPSGQTLTLAGLTANNSALYATSGTGAVAAATTNTVGLCLVSGASNPTWGSCGAGDGTSNWEIQQGAIMPKLASTLDLLIGGTSTASAKFAVLNVNNGTPTASISAGTNGAAFLTATGGLQTTAKQSLTLGGGDTGNVVISGFTSGVVKSDASGVLSASALNLASSEVSGVLGATNGGTGLNSFATGSLIYASGANTWAARTIGGEGSILTVQSGLPTWVSSSSLNYWQRASGTVAPLNITDDLLLGATATTSAKFAFMNNAGGTPTASISGNIVLNSTGSIQTTRNQQLTIGGNSTGNITLSPQNGGANGTVNVDGHVDLASGFSYKINGSSVLSTAALGSSVLGSSLTSVGTLTGGTWNANVIGTTYGGTGKNLTMSNGGIVWTDADSFEVLSANANSGLALVSGGAGTPSWFAPTAGSVLFAGANGALTQDNTNFFFDNTNNRLGIGNAAPSTTLHVTGGARITDLASCSSIQTDASGNLSCGSPALPNTASFSDTTSDTLADANNDLWDGTYANLTPTSTSNTILVAAQVRILQNTASQPSLVFTLHRAIGANPTCASTQVGNAFGIQTVNNYSNSISTSITILDSPASTGNVRYTVCSSTATEGTVTSITTPEIRFSLVELGADLAENYYTTDGSIVPGHIVSIDTSLPAGAKKSTTAYDEQALGVVSTAPGHVLDDWVGRDYGRPIPVALSGRVPVKVTTENGPIKPGDLITSSSTPGVGMKATKAGQIVGQAMTGFDGEGEGSVFLFVKTDYANGTSLADLIDMGSEPVPGKPEDFGQKLLTHFKSLSGMTIDNADMSEIFTDRLAAQNEIIAPKVTADTIRANTIEIASGNSLDLKLTSDESVFAVKNAAGEELAQFDAQGNLKIKGTLTADKIRANQIEGLDELLGSSRSAQLATDSDKIASLEAKTLSLTDKVASLEAQLNLSLLTSNFSPQSEASTAAELGLDTIDAKDVTVSNSLNVLGRTVLSELGVTGNITAGVLSINGLDDDGEASINTSSGPLKLQSNGLNGVDLFDGKVTFAVNGDIKTEGAITTKKLNIDTEEVAGASLGEAVLKAGYTNITIETSAVTAKSAVFITPRTKVSLPLSVTAQRAGESFTVEVDAALPRDVRFSWWVVN